MRIIRVRHMSSIGLRLDIVLAYRDLGMPALAARVRSNPPLDDDEQITDEDAARKRESQLRTYDGDG